MQTGQQEGRARGLLLHLHPPTVPEEALRFRRTLGLGGMALVLFVLLAMTGALLMLVYEPVPDRAYASLLVLRDQVPFGRWVRNIHHWSANAMVVVSVLHLLRVFFTGGLVDARRSNWWIGLGLLACVVASVFTGYLLPWDQLSYWAVTICTGMLEYVPWLGPWLQDVARGGSEIGAPTLLNFFTLHTSILPGALIVLSGFHFWRVRKARGVILPADPALSGPARAQRARSNPDLVVREGAVALILTAGVLLFSAFVDAHLGAVANPGMSPNPAKAPWYFLGLQELLLHFHPVVAIVVLPALAVLGMILLPYVPQKTREDGVWFTSLRGRRLAAIAAAAMLAATPLAVFVDDRFYRGGAVFGFVPGIVSGGILPVALLGGILFGTYRTLRRRLDASPRESVQTLCVALFVAFLVCTATGIWFRGAGMALMFPWSLSP
jgi:quinol-cytochrome oxidoreductase complex cytochrome b subunit